MKIYRNKKMYVMLGDIAALINLGETVPDSVMIKLLVNGIRNINASNCHTFFAFRDIEDIDYFKYNRYILDFDDFESLNEEQIMQVSDTIEEKMSEIYNYYISLNENARKNYGDLLKEYELYQYELCTISEYLAFREGSLELDIPKEKCNNKYKKHAIFLTQVFNSGLKNKIRG